MRALAITRRPWRDSRGGFCAASTLWSGLALAAAALVLGGCLDAWKRPAKAPISALWITAGSEPLEASDLARLREAGVEELILTVAELDLDDPRGPLVPVEAPGLPGAVPTTLAVAGRWRDPGTAAKDVGRRIVEAARRLRFELEGRGGIPVGLHFDLAQVDSLGSYAQLLKRLRRKLDRTLFLSASLQREWLDKPEIAAVAEAVDFVVPFLYGQRIHEAEDADAWDFIELEGKLQALEELGVPYLLGVVGLGTATHLDGRGAVKARWTRLSLQEVLWNRALKLRAGFSLEGVNRRIYTVVAERPTRVGKWDVKPGETVRMMRAATSDLEELMRLLGAWEMPHHLGQVYYRLPAAEERLSLSLENLLNALDAMPATPDLHFEVTLQRRTGRGWLVRVAIVNLNGEITELSLLDSNFIQVRCLNGVFGSRVDLGDFYRYDLFRVGDDGEMRRTFRSPDALRLYLPILEGQQKVVTGDVEVRLRGEPKLELWGRFLLPDGRTLDVGPEPWPEG